MPWLTVIIKIYNNRSPYGNEALSLSSPIKHLQDNNKIREIDNLWKGFELNVLKGEKIVLYGAGVMGRILYECNKNKEYCDILLWVDKNAGKIGSIEGTTIDLPQRIEALEKRYDRIVIANASPRVAKEIRDELSAMGVEVTNSVTIG